MLDELTFDRVVQAYGMTNVERQQTQWPPTVLRLSTTIGKASKDLEVRIVDEIHH